MKAKKIEIYSPKLNKAYHLSWAILLGLVIAYSLLYSAKHIFSMDSGYIESIVQFLICLAVFTFLVIWIIRIVIFLKSPYLKKEKMPSQKNKMGLIKFVTVSLGRGLLILFIGFMALVGIYDTIEFFYKEYQNSKSNTKICDSVKQVEQLKVIYRAKVKNTDDLQFVKGFDALLNFEYNNIKLSDDELAKNEELNDYSLQLISNLTDKQRDIDAKINAIERCYILDDDVLQIYQQMLEKKDYKQELEDKSKSI